MAYSILYILDTHSSLNLNVIECWFSVDEKEPVAYAKVEVIEACDMKPSDLNGYPLPMIRVSFFFYNFYLCITNYSMFQD